MVVKGWADLGKDRKGFQQLCSDWVSGRMEKRKLYLITNKQIISVDFYECSLKGRIWPLPVLSPHTQILIPALSGSSSGILFSHLY